MNYLILECKSDTAEYMFWKDVICFPGFIICSSGNTHIITKLEELKDKLDTGDNIFVFYDVINKYSSVLGKKVTNSVNLTCMYLRKYEKCFGVHCFISVDLCFESMLYRLTNILNRNIINDEMCEFIKCNYIGDCTKHFDITKLFQEARNKGITNEEYVASILHNITVNTHLCVTKGSLGRCWTSSCGYKNLNGSEKLAYVYDNKKLKTLERGYCTKVISPLCGHKFNTSSPGWGIDRHLEEFKQDMILSDLCNGDWHKLFKSV